MIILKMTDQEKEDCIDNIYQDLVKYSNKNISNIVCDYISKKLIIHFIFLQIKGNNTTLLQLLWYVFKNYEYMREIINNNMIQLLIASFDNSDTFFEMFKWYEEFSYNRETASSDITVALYIQANKYPTLKKHFFEIIHQINNVNNIQFRTIFFINDEVDIIKPYLINNNSVTNRIIIRCYHYDAINTLKQIQYKYKIKFFNVSWYLLSPLCFNNHMDESKRNPYDDEIFATNWINYVCVSLHWDYLPTMINKLTAPMWKIIKNYFYMGYLDLRFITVLFHQMKLNDIPYEKLKSNSLKFVVNDNESFLKENNSYDIFANTKGIVIKNLDLDNIALESTVVSVTSMMVIFSEKRIDALTEIIFDSTLNLSSKYKSEIKYIDDLLENNQLGWNTTQIKTYNNFKMIMNRIMDEANLIQNLIDKYNSFIPLNQNNMPNTYQLRYLNHFINIYKKITIKKFKDNMTDIYNSCVKLKHEFIKIIRKETNTTLDHNILFVLPENATILDQFKNLIENSSCYDYSKDNLNDFWINELKDNDIIRNIVRNMLARYHVPIQEIIPVLYNYYNNYATEEHFFLE